MKKLIPAIVMLLVSAVVLSTASYAWFTTSRSVSADGMQVTASAPTSILIRGKADNNNWTAYSNILNFGDIYSNVKLTPTSSANGVDFYVPANAYDAAGAMDHLTNITKLTSGTGYYVDFQIELKNDSVSQEVDLAVIKVVDEVKSAMSNSIRVAIITGSAGEAATNNTAAPTPTTTNTTVYTIEGYTEQWINVASKDANENLVYTTPATGPIEGEYKSTDAAAWTEVAKGSAKGDECYTAVNTKDIITLAPQECVQITIRVWFEGQDKTCISANAGASANLSVEFGILAEREYTTPADTTAPEVDDPAEG